MAESRALAEPEPARRFFTSNQWLDDDTGSQSSRVSGRSFGLSAGLQVRNSARATARASAIHYVDAHLEPTRFRALDEIVDQLQCVVPGVSVQRFARSGGILFRFVLNMFVAMQQLLRISTGGRVSKLLILAELTQLATQLLTLIIHLLPLSLGRRGGAPWRRAAESCHQVRRLSTYSQLGHITRLKHVIPGVWSHYVVEASQLQEMRRANLSVRRVLFIEATARVMMFGAVELMAAWIGLASLHQKLHQIRGLESGFIPFFGFANQVTGIIDQEELRMLTVLQTIFAGESTDLDVGASEAQAIREFHGALLERLCYSHGLAVGFFLYLSLNSEDYRRLIVSKREGTAPQVRRLGSGRLSVINRRWWLFGANEDMLLGRVITVADILRYQLGPGSTEEETPRPRRDGRGENATDSPHDSSPGSPVSE